VLDTDLFSDNVALTDSGADLFYSADRYDWQNTMARVEHEWIANSRLDATFSGYFTHHTFDHSYMLTNTRQAISLPYTSYAVAQYEFKQLACRTTYRRDLQAMITSVS